MINHLDQFLSFTGWSGRWGVRIRPRARPGGAGLEQFKRGFGPGWRPLYAAAPTRLGLLRAGIEIATTVHRHIAHLAFFDPVDAAAAERCGSGGRRRGGPARRVFFIIISDLGGIAVDDDARIVGLDDGRRGALP